MPYPNRHTLLPILVTVALSACTGSRHHRVNNVLMGVAGATLACDYGQTVRRAHEGWINHYEANPVLGETPDVVAVTSYFGAIMFTGGLLSTLLPEWARSALYVGVAAIQTKTVIGNVGTGSPWCGVWP